MNLYASQLQNQFPGIQAVGLDEVNNKLDVIVKDSIGTQTRSISPLIQH